MPRIPIIVLWEADRKLLARQGTNQSKPLIRPRKELRVLTATYRIRLLRAPSKPRKV